MFPTELNRTNIILIPKKKKPTYVFRLINLYNVTYKLISKVIIDNRLKKWLPDIISPTESAFVLEKLIIDNILVAYELIHFLNDKRNGKNGFMSLKLNIGKPYDQVRWEFLEDVMSKMGLGRKLVNLIMYCVKSVSYAVLINGEPLGNVLPSRGIRQGDRVTPSPFLFFVLH